MASTKIQRRAFLQSAGLLGGAALLRIGFAEAAERPNFVILLADDEGWGDLSVHGNKNVSTPNIDSLARDGALFDHFFVCPVCAPTRAEFLTGRYYPRSGVHGVSTGQERMNPDEVTIADTFKAAGYATGAFGKWHNGTQYPYHPNARGFDEFFGFTSGHWGQYFDPLLEHNGELMNVKGFITDILTDHAMAFIEQNRNKPFFCYVPYNTPHSPMQVPDQFYEKFDGAEIAMRNRDPEAEDLGMTRAALAMTENIDYNVGRMLAKLDELGLADNTVVIYFSDNGPNSYRWNEGMKGRKGSTDEGGLRVPFLIRWPGHIPAGKRIPEIAGAIDILPTLTDLAGVPLMSKKPLDGKSIKTLLTGEASEWPDRMLMTYRKGGASVRTQQYRLDPAGHLYDIPADPGQYKDISKEKPEIAARLKKAADEFLDEVKGVEDDDRAFAVGHREYPNTMLPARDGVAHGGVQRSAGAPNCSYFTNWTKPDDTITWDIEIATPGRYEAIVYYACPEKDLGATFELAFKDARFKSKVTVANDPPAIGAAFDRVQRKGESYVKDFKPMSLGTGSLPGGRGLLTLKALDIPGSQVMEVRMLVLKLLA